MKVTRIRARVAFGDLEAGDRFTFHWGDQVQVKTSEQTSCCLYTGQISIPSAKAFVFNVQFNSGTRKRVISTYQIELNQEELDHLRQRLDCGTGISFREYCEDTGVKLNHFLNTRIREALSCA